MKIMHIVGARPNFMKVAPTMQTFRDEPRIEQILVHTGQHYDYEMSQVFFEDLGIPAPDAYLQVGSGSHADQTARIMLAFEPVIVSFQPDWVFVVGDVNSTLACSLVSAKLGIPVSHIEAGLRSFDRTMPEEINRLLTDQISDLLFTPSTDADENLIREGVDPQKICLVGNVMIDTLVQMLPKAVKRPVVSELGLPPGGYILVTLHRPSNVDDKRPFAEILSALQELAGDYPVVFPVHPRTRKQIDEFGLEADAVKLMEPLGYLDFLALTRSAAMVLTDSGGIQEETTFLGVPCLTLRPNTERPITIELGTNRLVKCERAAIVAAAYEAVQSAGKLGSTIPLWDGLASQRILAEFRNRFF